MTMSFYSQRNLDIDPFSSWFWVTEEHSTGKSKRTLRLRRMFPGAYQLVDGLRTSPKAPSALYKYKQFSHKLHSLSQVPNCNTTG